MRGVFLRVLLCVVFIALFTSYFSNIALAQSLTPQHNQASDYLNTNPDVPQNLSTYVQSVAINVLVTGACVLSGVNPADPTTPCLGIDPDTKKIGYIEGGQGGAVALVGNLIAGTFYIPVSSHTYGTYLAQNFGIVDTAYAQEGGVGFAGLKPILSVWETFRNMTYLIFVVLFIVIGLGIMFRVKIDPRTVMTLQNQIPKIIVALILVTFSYAIAGFLIDMMYVSLYVIISLFAGQGIDPVDITASNPFQAAGGLGGLSSIANKVAHVIGGIIASFFSGTLGTILSTVVGGIIGAFMGGGGVGLSAIAGPVVGGLIGALGGALFGSQIIGLISGLVAYLIVMIALISALLRLWFVLIKSYIYILLSVVTAPFYIASGLIPGRSGIGAWFRTILSNIVVFPITIALLLFGKTLVEGFKSGGVAGGKPFVPPLVGDFLRPDDFGAILGLGVILMLPEVANMAKEALKAPENKFSTSIGRSIGAGTGLLTTPAAHVFGKAWGIDPMTKEPRILQSTVSDQIKRRAPFLAKPFSFVFGEMEKAGRNGKSYYQEREDAALSQKVATRPGARTQSMKALATDQHGAPKHPEKRARFDAGRKELPRRMGAKRSSFWSNFIPKNLRGTGGNRRDPVYSRMTDEEKIQQGYEPREPILKEIDDTESSEETINAARRQQNTAAGVNDQETDTALNELKVEINALRKAFRDESDKNSARALGLKADIDQKHNLFIETARSKMIDPSNFRGEEGEEENNGENNA